MSVHVNKVVLVTGTSSGIGAAIAEVFTSEGARVAMVGRNEAKLKNVAAKCEKLGHKPLVIVGDVTKDDDNQRIIKETIKTYGKLDVLVNNAAAPGAKTGIKYDNCMEYYELLMATNLRGPIKLTNLAIKYLLESKGNIVNISSIASMKPMGINFPYSISKAALDHFTRCIAYELGADGVRANSIMAGPVKTDIFSNLGKGHKNDQIFESLRVNTALMRISDPEEIAHLVSFLASDKARGITGSAVTHDNGLMIKGTFK